MNEIAALTARSSGHLYRSHIDRSKAIKRERAIKKWVPTNQGYQRNMPGLPAQPPTVAPTFTAHIIYAIILWPSSLNSMASKGQVRVQVSFARQKPFIFVSSADQYLDMHSYPPH